jgi:hypothetical protein
MTLQSAYFMGPVVRLIKQALRSASRIGANVLSATAGAFVHVIAKCDHHSGNIRVSHCSTTAALKTSVHGRVSGRVIDRATPFQLIGRFTIQLVADAGNVARTCPPAVDRDARGQLTRKAARAREELLTIEEMSMATSTQARSESQPTLIHRGHGLCKSVQYEIHGPRRPVVYCHCQMCRRTSSHFIAALHKERLIEYDRENESITISPLGIAEVEELILPKVG